MKYSVARLIVWTSLIVGGVCLLGPSVAEAIRLPMERVCRALDDAARFAKTR